MTHVAVRPAERLSLLVHAVGGRRAQGRPPYGRGPLLLDAGLPQAARRATPHSPRQLLSKLPNEERGYDNRDRKSHCKNDVPCPRAHGATLMIGFMLLQLSESTGRSDLARTRGPK